jgi:hypothetical protein
MTPERTELEWLYQPQDLFEAAYRCAESEYDLLVEDGRALATLKTPQDPVDEQLEKRIAERLDAILRVRQLRKHQSYKLQGPRVYQHGGGVKNVAIKVGSDAVAISVGQVDTVIRDGAGNVLRDTRAERIAEHTAMLDSIAPKLARSPVLRELFNSYSRSISDPSNELVHLYEVRDALVAHYGGEQNARAALCISGSEWGRLGRLANAEPLEQGRHRGDHVTGRRDATAAELEEARSIVQRWIVAFAKIT